jgi:hydrogen peroxide-dependent heme synthase
MHNPEVPETLEGWSLLHQMFRLRWSAVREAGEDFAADVAAEAAEALRSPADAADGHTALVQLLGKGDLMVVHARRSFEGLSQAQLALSRTGLWDWLEPVASFVSIVELGMYEMTAKIHQQLGAQGLETGSDAFERAFDEEMERQRARVMSRLYCELPRMRHVCFYPMNKRRGEVKNWYSVPFEQRARMMREHGMVGRHYSGKVTQIISGAIGFDDWEWGVDLFAPDPLVFKKLIYEMRFDEASADYGEFGPFYVGLQFSPAQLGVLLRGETPSLD